MEQNALIVTPFDLVICAGAAGALAREVTIGDVIVATSTFEHDYNNFALQVVGEIVISFQLCLPIALDKIR